MNHHKKTHGAYRTICSVCGHEVRAHKPTVRWHIECWKKLRREGYLIGKHKRKAIADIQPIVDLQPAIPSCSNCKLSKTCVIDALCLPSLKHWRKKAA